MPTLPYERRRPEQTTLYQVVADNLETLYGALEDGAVHFRLAKHARKELEAYLDCGILCRGFARLWSADCKESRLVAFSCKGRGFCPSCLGRRMCGAAANLAHYILPEQSLRQWVLTFPFAWRARLAHDGALLSALTACFTETVLALYDKATRKQKGSQGQSGAIVVLQRTSSDLRLNPHIHSVFLDGAYGDSPTGVRPPIAQVRIVPGPDGLVRIVLKRAFGDGTKAIDLDPLSLLCRLAASVPPPRYHIVKYAGVLAPHSKLRRKILPRFKNDVVPHHRKMDGCGCRYWPWAALMRRTFGYDVLECPKCKGRLKLIAMVTETASIVRFLSAVGETTTPPPRAPPRGPPYWQSTGLAEDGARRRCLARSNRGLSPRLRGTVCPPLKSPSKITSPLSCLRSCTMTCPPNVSFIQRGPSRGPGGNVVQISYAPCHVGRSSSPAPAASAAACAAVGVVFGGPHPLAFGRAIEKPPHAIVCA